MSLEAPPPILSNKRQIKRKNGKDADISLETRLPRISTLSLSSPATGTSPSLPGTPTLGATRKVSSRRKALQDFYKLHQEGGKESESEQDFNKFEPKSEKDALEDQELTARKEAISLAEELKDPEAINAFIKNASASELLKVRNQASGKLNFHDSEKKSIIYDNYYELIKLNQVLSDLSGREKKKSILDEDQAEVVNDEHLRKVLGELSSFLDNTASKFDQGFTLVVNCFSEDSKRADSFASIRTIREGE